MKGGIGVNRNALDAALKAVADPGNDVGIGATLRTLDGPFPMPQVEPLTDSQGAPPAQQFPILAGGSKGLGRDHGGIALCRRHLS